MSAKVQRNLKGKKYQDNALSFELGPQKQLRHTQTHTEVFLRGIHMSCKVSEKPATILFYLLMCSSAEHSSI